MQVFYVLTLEKESTILGLLWEAEEIGQGFRRISLGKEARRPQDMSDGPGN